MRAKLTVTFHFLPCSAMALQNNMYANGMLYHGCKSCELRCQHSSTSLRQQDCHGRCLASPHITSLHLTSPYLASPRLTSHHFTSPRLTLPRLTSHHFTSPRLTLPRLTSHHITLPYLALPSFALQSFVFVSLCVCLSVCVCICMYVCM